jgi:hypothetical protein
MDFILGTSIKVRRSSGTICSGIIKKIEGEYITINGKCGRYKVHESQVITK